MKILWIDHIYLDSEAHSTFPLFLINSLIKKDHDVNLLVPSIKKNTKDTTLLKNNIQFVPIIRLPLISSITFFFMLLFYLPKTIKETRPDAIVVDKYALPGVICSIFFPNIKLIVDIRSTYVWEVGIRGFLDKTQYYFSVALAKHLSDGITVTSSALREELCDLFQIDSTKIVAITNGVSSHLLEYDNENVTEQLRKELNLDKKFVIAYHGSLGWKRGLNETVEALEKLVPKYPDIVFFVLGSGHGQTRLSDFVKEKSLGDYVYFHDAVSHVDMAKFISLYDLGIAALDTMSYPRTSCPLKVLEYLSLGKTVVATDIPFNREILKHGDSMILIPSNTPEEIADAVEYAYKNRKKIKQMGEIGREIIERYYTWDKKADEFVDFIEAVENER